MQNMMRIRDGVQEVIAVEDAALWWYRGLGYTATDLPVTNPTPQPSSTPFVRTVTVVNGHLTVTNNFGITVDLGPIGGTVTNPGGGTGGGSTSPLVAYDTDGAPYLTSIGTAGSPVQYDTDGVPYLVTS